jgi:hypothetical protein
VNFAVGNYLGARAPRLYGNSAIAFTNLCTVVDPLKVAMWLARRSRLKRSITPTALGTKLYAGVCEPPLGSQGLRLFISERTFGGHVRSILNKLGINSRAEIADRIASSSER